MFNYLGFLLYLKFITISWFLIIKFFARVFTMRKSELMQKFRQFCSALSPLDNVVLVHHSDADGFCSGIIAAKAVEKLTGKKPVAVQPYEYGNKKQARKIVDAIKKEKANKVIIVDIGIDSAQHSLQQLCPEQQCLVIDHHQMFRDLNSEKIVFLKAEFFTKKDPSAYVTSKFAFDLFNQVADVSECDWIACLGILGDMNLHTWQGFVRSTIGKRKISMTQLYSMLDLIAAVEVLANEKMPELFNLFYNAKTPEEVLESKFKHLLAKFKKEKDALVAGFAKKAQHFPECELYFYSIKSVRDNIKSYVVNELSQMHPKETVILLQYLGSGRIRFSARRQDFKVKMNELLREATKGLPGATAGGHIPAAAGSIRRQDLRKFKRDVVEILGKK
jgi:oligoribonuclease NrnB/cAMP/cGMP phosphodiesterase (DHH superfamily)